jgi:N-acetylglucosamine malate deacetylase 1
MERSRELYDAVVFSPHPDDAEMSIAGTIMRMVRSGRRVLCVSLTGGEKGTYGTHETRRMEYAAANAIMGTDGRILDFPDTQVTNTPEGRLEIARIVRAHRPKIVFAPYHTNVYGHHDGSANSDHWATGQLVRDGLKLARFKNVIPEIPAHDVDRLYYYMIPKDKLPTIVVDVTDLIDDIHRAIVAYETQMQIRRQENTVLEILDAMRIWNGIRIGKRYGEAFLSDEALEFGPDTFFET